ncbi:MAG: transglutaminase domain-containing protein [Lachnospiraceae bacterium]|nr:transglutaminase domain-containing protein [Lachnospiraceae bacterium]
MYHQGIFSNKTAYAFYRLLLPVLLVLLFCSGCGKKQEAYVSASTTIRDNTPVCLVPSADGITTLSNDYVDIDTSHTEEGYLMVDYKGSCPKVKLQIVGPDYMTYTYDLVSTGYDVFPLSAGDGTYQLGVYENIQDSQYATVFAQEISVTLTNPYGPFLYPNQYVKFDASNQIVATAKELAAPAHDDLEVISFVYNYVTTNITYDYEKAATVQSGYVPNADEILSLKKGICLDYASMMAGMLRSQQIPTRLEVGYAGDAYHAWISTYVENQGWINGIIQFDGQSWSLMDPTFAANAGDKELKSFIGDGSNYVTKYIY